MRRLSALGSVFAAGAAFGCSSTGPNPGSGPLPSPSVACASVAALGLAAGEHVVLDPASNKGCVRFPAAGGSGAEYLAVLVSTTSARSTNGVQGGYLLHTSTPAVALEMPAAPRVVVETPRAEAPHWSNAARFDAMLRERERELLADPRNRALPLAAPEIAAAPPQVGDTNTYKVCGDITCSTFVTVTAVVKFVGQHVAVILDTSVPTNDPLQPADFAELGNAFDQYHYPIDTTAFGRESDLDANGVVKILLTDGVNALTPDCTNGRIIGFFFGGDLLTGANSNHGEIFYTLVPAPATAHCTAIGRRAVLDNLKPTLIHEFQHMISFNQHRLLRGGSTEETWLNEAMSHFAEELGGRLVPDSECTKFGFPSCRSQYTSGDIINAYDYLSDPESFFLFPGTNSSGTLEERGAEWLFLRWSLDHFSTDTILATQTTRALDGTSQTGTANIAAVTGGSVPTMIAEAMMAYYLDDGTELPVEATGLLRLKSWGLRSIWTNPANAQFFPGGFPIVPDQVGTSYVRIGTLLAGSGRHFLVTQGANGVPVDMQVVKDSSGAALSATLQSRVGVVRIR